MAPSISHLLLLAAIIPFSASVPFTGTGRHTIARTRSSLPSDPFRRIRDTVIERLWGISRPAKSQPCHTCQPTVPSNYRTRYGNDVVLRFRFDTDEELKALSEATQTLYLDVWEISAEWVDIRISKNIVPSLLGLLPYSLRHAHAPVMHDLAQAVYDTYPDTQPSTHHASWKESPITTNTDASYAPRDMFFSEYQPLSVLYPWLRLMASMFPSHVQLTTIGQSAEGRDIPALRVGARRTLPPDHEDVPRKTIVITGGSHAREWISVSTVSYIAWSLTTRYGDPRSDDVTRLLDHFDVVFLPTLNPDGYHYTWTTDRLWRKNRQETPLPFCPGIDIDRSFSFGWDGDDSSDNPCSEAFPGSTSLEAVEAKALNDWAKNQTDSNNVTFVGYLDMHSYSQEVLYPYSFSCFATPPNLEDLEEVAIGLAKAFRLTHGHYYGVSSACEGSITSTSKDKTKKVRQQMEFQGGSALDFFYHDLGVKYAFQVKLRDTGSYGFLLPKQHIVPTGFEAFEAVLGLSRWLLSNHGIEKYEQIWKEADSEHEESMAPGQFFEDEIPEIERDEVEDIAQEVIELRR